MGPPERSAVPVSWCCEGAIEKRRHCLHQCLAVVAIATRDGSRVDQRVHDCLFDSDPAARHDFGINRQQQTGVRLLLVFLERRVEQNGALAANAAHQPTG